MALPRLTETVPCHGHFICFSSPNLLLSQRMPPRAALCECHFDHVQVHQMINPRIGMSGSEGLWVFNLRFTAKLSSQETLPGDSPTCSVGGEACFPHSLPLTGHVNICFPSANVIGGKC